MKTKTKYLTRAIFHVDADAFFASCEQSLNSRYRGKPVVVGRERGIVVAFSYEAKAIGIKRGMSIYEVKQNHPEVIILPGNYEAYSLFSKRIFSLLRRYTDRVEEYSIDEAFADMTGMEKPLKMTYEEIGKDIQATIQKELGIGVSIGISETKSLAKLASSVHKPAGLALITKEDIPDFLKKVSVGSIWGVGSSTAHYMNQSGMYTAWSFVVHSHDFVEKHFTKPHQEIWRELRGEMVYCICTEAKTSFASISKTHTFSFPSKDKGYIFAELVKNMENACTKARSFHLSAKKIRIFLKRQDFTFDTIELCLHRNSAYPHDMMKCIRDAFETLYTKGTLYRATGIVLSELGDEKEIQMNLFESSIIPEKFSRVYSAIDALSKKFGKNTLHLGSSLKAQVSKHYAPFSVVPVKKHINIPHLSSVH